MSPEQIAAALRKYYAVMENIDSPVIRWEWLMNMAQYIGFPPEILVADYNAWQRTGKPQ